MRLNRCVRCMPMTAAEFAKQPCTHRPAIRKSTVDLVLQTVATKAHLLQQRRPELTAAAARTEVWKSDPRLLTAYRDAVKRRG
jgi:hypothetical protein